MRSIWRDMGLLWGATRFMAGFISEPLWAQTRGMFRTAVRALKGWTKAAPQIMRDPLPYGAVCWLVLRFLRRDLVLTAAAALWQFDAYLRPSEALTMNRDDIIPPTPRAGTAYRNRWMLMVGNQLRRVRAKTRVVDGTIEVGDKVRPVIRDMVRELHRITKPRQTVF